jgi:hypothetical protein
MDNSAYKDESLSIPYDVIELPSQGLLYPNKQSTVKIEYLTTMDESILSSPNLLENGLFLDTLLDRKVKNSEIPPKEMLMGDRMAILVFLRSTGYGPIYPIRAYDSNTSAFFDTEFDLSTLKVKKLNIKPDKDNMFDYILPNTKKNVKFKILTGEQYKKIDERDEAYQKRSGTDQSNKVVYTLEEMIKNIDGETDALKISSIIHRLPIMDSRSLREYASSIEPGLDFNITVRTPGGASVDTFLTIGRQFFWPDIRV